jgi:hypothetical protein
MVTRRAVTSHRVTPIALAAVPDGRRDPPDGRRDPPDGRRDPAVTVPSPRVTQTRMALAAVPLAPS